MKTFAAIILSFFAGGVTWYLAEPLFFDDVVDESFPYDTYEAQSSSSKVVDVDEERMMKMVKMVVEEDIDNLPMDDVKELAIATEELMENAMMMTDEEEEAMKTEIRAMAEKKVFYSKWKDSPQYREKILSQSLSDEEMAMLKKIETMTMEEVVAMSAEEMSAVKQKADVIAANMPDVPVDELMEVQPVLEVEGAFSGADSFHKSEGSARVFTLPDGSKLLRLEDFSVTNGPALSVYLVQDKNGDPSSGFVSLGELKGNMGNQNYEIPAGTDVSEYGSVIVHCVPFNVTFAIAPLQN